MTDAVIDLSKPTGHFEVSVWHYADDRYSVDRDRGYGRCTVYETDRKDKALGVAEYLEQNGRSPRTARAWTALSSRTSASPSPGASSTGTAGPVIPQASGPGQS